VRQYYKDQDCRGHHTNMHVGMFTKKASPNANYPKMRGRACEVTMPGSAHLDAWPHYCDAGSVAQSQIRLLLTYSVSIEKVLSDTAGSNYLEPAVFAPSWSIAKGFWSSTALRTRSSHQLVCDFQHHAKAAFTLACVLRSSIAASSVDMVLQRFSIEIRIVANVLQGCTSHLGNCSVMFCSDCGFDR
jgi:hypothetical protein